MTMKIGDTVFISNESDFLYSDVVCFTQPKKGQAMSVEKNAHGVLVEMISDKKVDATCGVSFRGAKGPVVLWFRPRNLSVVSN